ncbi:MAG: GxxExxY protein [Ignavibacteriota bacterium]|nr:GxxExxY protein [Ignavibacteriota bacterium]MEB2355340.1 GxxExxY protein [Ignavibacteriales bacterium]QKK01151.1 MAG: GxxExxY protein [Ignavibacteriota bacterium]HOJ08712.1 GxxExxY protein [Ignavibacteriaceae bacterium]
MASNKQYVNNLSCKIVGCAIKVHKQLGPGLLESVYQTCFVDKLISQGLKVNRQVAVTIYYKGKDLVTNLILDLLISDLVIVELKAVETIIPVFNAQLLSYLKLTGKPKGLLINFHCQNIKDHLIPLVTEEFSKLSESKWSYW